MVEWHHQLNGHEFEEALELVMDREAGGLEWAGIGYFPLLGCG